MNNNNKTHSEKSNLDALIHRLQNEDSQYARIVKNFQVVYWIFIPLFSIVALFSFIETNDIIQLIGDLCFIISFLIFALFFGRFYKEYKCVNYSKPTIRMLKEAAYRYKPFQLKTIWLFIALLFIDVGLCLNRSLNFPVLKVQLYFISVIIMSTIIGLIIWYYKYKPLRDSAMYLIKEIEGK